jgi:hypothetical protein
MLERKSLVFGFGSLVWLLLEIIKDLSPKTKGRPPNRSLLSVRPHHKKQA